MNQYSKKKDSSPVAGHRVTRSARILFVASLLALFMVIAGALPALAASDGKIYPGSMGVRYAGTSTPCLSHSAIGNPSATKWLYLDLPAIHDKIAGKIKKSWVRVSDRNCKANIRCRLVTRYRCGCGWCGWVGPGPKYSKGCKCYEQVLNTGGANANKRSHYYFSCRIPPKYNNKISYINSYYVEEN